MRKNRFLQIKEWLQKAVFLIAFRCRGLSDCIGIAGLFDKVECLISPVQNGVNCFIGRMETTDPNRYGDMLFFSIFGQEFLIADKRVDSFQLLTGDPLIHRREDQDEFVASPTDQNIALARVFFDCFDNLTEDGVTKVVAVLSVK